MLSGVPSPFDLPMVSDGFIMFSLDAQWSGRRGPRSITGIGQQACFVD